MLDPTVHSWRFALVAVLGLHAAIHVVGAPLLWEVAEVGEFTFDMATPTAGTRPAIIVGAAWLAAAVVFVGAAAALAGRRRRWRLLVFAASVVSVPVLAIDVGDAGAGLVVDVVLVAIASSAPKLDEEAPRRTEDALV